MDFIFLGFIDHISVQDCPHGFSKLSDYFISMELRFLGTTYEYVLLDLILWPNY